jgi:hypothetical protein
MSNRDQNDLAGLGAPDAMQVSDVVDGEYPGFIKVLTVMQPRDARNPRSECTAVPTVLDRTSAYIRAPSLYV